MNEPISAMVIHTACLLTDGILLTDNAYVSGMKDDLGFVGNELVQLQTMYVVGAVVGQIPFMFLFTVFPMNWVIPFLDVCWGIFTLLQFRANSFAEMAAYRFLVGWFEVRIAAPISYAQPLVSHVHADISQRRHSSLPCITYLAHGTEVTRSLAGAACSMLGSRSGH